LSSLEIDGSSEALQLRQLVPLTRCSAKQGREESEVGMHTITMT